MTAFYVEVGCVVEDEETEDYGHWKVRGFDINARTLYAAEQVAHGMAREQVKDVLHTWIYFSEKTDTEDIKKKDKGPDFHEVEDDNLPF